MRENIDSAEFDKLFKNPDSQYRGAPFWAWNTKLEAQELCRQIENLKKMGFGGFFMHTRTGLATEYLGGEFMDMVGVCVEKAKQEGMLAYLYDEDRWPSGSAGGLVTKNPEYRAKYLLLTRTPYSEEDQLVAVEDSSARAARTGNGSLVACFDVVLDDEGRLQAYQQIQEQQPAQHIKLYAYLETPLPNPWFNNQTYVDTLNPKAIQEFIALTYQRYQSRFGQEFGQAIPAVFTDEPQFSIKQSLGFAESTQDVTLPWTADFAKTYAEAYDGEDIVAKIPELLWDLPAPSVSCPRYRYHDHVAERFASAFADQCGQWCQDHQIALTGHMMMEPQLESQTAALGDAMRSLRSFQIPGVDMLCDMREYTTVKQAQSVARQYGRAGVMSELYGVTNWDFDFRGHKLQGDWMAAMGVTLRVPHLSWVSMNGEAKRDYPASLNHQSPWFAKYPLIEDHFARLNTALTRGKPAVRVGMIHPVESYWLHWGPKMSSQALRDQLESDFQNITEWLLFGQIDFDYLCESLLAAQCTVLDQVHGEGRFVVGQMQYDCILVPPVDTLRSSTLERLNAFAAAGGKILFLGQPPRYADALPSDSGRLLYEKSTSLPCTKYHLLEGLAPFREVEITDEQAVRTDDLLYQLREDGDCRWLFLAHGKRENDEDIPHKRKLRLRIKGEWAAEIYNTLTGEASPANGDSENGFTFLDTVFYEHDSLLLRLSPPGSPCAKNQAAARAGASAPCILGFPGAVPVTLDEPNVLVLDMAEYALDQGPLRQREEILRLDDAVRQELGFPHRGEAIAQPWATEKQPADHQLTLRYTFHSQLALSQAQLALENAKTTEVFLNGEAARLNGGWYVDRCFETVSLPKIKAGENTLELRLAYGADTNLEACYLLGDFGVEVQGCRCTLTPPVKTLAFGDICCQGLPFYGGNLTYHLGCAIPASSGQATLSATYYRAALLSVSVNGQPAGDIAFAPYQLELSQLRQGGNNIDITVYGCRVNTFGQLHKVSRKFNWWGPSSWRTRGADFSYEYLFWKQGLLKSPEINF